MLILLAIMPHRRANNPASHRLARLSFLLGLAALAGVAALGPLYRFGRIDLETMLLGLRYGGLAGIAAILLGAITAILGRPGHGRRGFVSGSLGILLGLAAAFVPMHWLWLSRTLPPIHDIVTDTVDPPPLARRGEVSPQSNAYEGARLAALQKQAYPDIVPLLLPIAPAEAFARAEKIAVAMGWQILLADARTGRIDAVARSDWFGFEDDVAIRVRATAAGSRIDMRSRSRVGVSDLGANADRIRRFFRRLQG